MLNDFGIESACELLKSEQPVFFQLDVDAQIDIFADLIDNQIILDLPLTENSFWISEAYSDFLSAGYSEGVPSLFNSLSIFSHPNYPLFQYLPS